MPQQPEQQQTSSRFTQTSPDRRRRMQRILQTLREASQDRLQRQDPPAPEGTVPPPLDPIIGPDGRPWHPPPPSEIVQPPVRLVANPGGRFRRLQHVRADRISRTQRNFARDAEESLAELYEAGERLSQVNEDLRLHLSRPTGRPPGGGTPQGSTREALENTEASGDGNGSRKKRRMTGHPSPPASTPNVYGYYGQVVPGRLKLQMVSCDGGIMEPDTGTYGAENVLRDDASVYCTKSSRCNMVLSHQGGTSFSLERLVIKAPRTGFTAPIQEGLVFVTMNKDLNIFERTAQYQIHHYPSSRFAHMAGERLVEQIRAAGIPASSTTQVPTILDPPLEPETHQRVDCWDSEEEAAEREATELEHWLTPNITFESPMAETSSDSDGEQRSPVVSQGATPRPDARSLLGVPLSDRMYLPNDAALALARRRIGSRRRTGFGPASRRSRSPPTAARALAIDEAAAPIWARQSGSHRQRSPMSREYQDMLDQFDFNEVLRRGDAAAADRRGRRHVMEAEADQDLDEITVREPLVFPPSTSSVTSFELLAPVARFSMCSPRKPFDHKDEKQVMEEQSHSEHIPVTSHDFRPQYRIQPTSTVPFSRLLCTTSNKMTIQFDPPISGRYILLKMWSPKQGGNIDVESINAYGFSGPRWFPKVQMR